MIAPTSALLDPPAPAPHGSEPPGSPPDTPFSTVLDDHQARTAVAEGPQTQRQDDARDASDSQPSVRDDDGAGTAGRADRDDAATGSTDDDSAHDGDGAPPQPAALAALLGGVPLPAGVATAVVARLPVAAPASPRAAAASAATGLPGAPAAAPAQTGAMPTGPAVPAAATALPLGPAAGQSPAAVAAATPSANVSADSVSTGASGLPSGLAAAADALQAPAARPAAAGAAKATPVAAPAAPVAAPGTAADPSVTSSSTNTGTAAQQAPAVQAAQPAPTTAPAALPATPPAGAPTAAPADGAAIAGGVGLEHAVETVRLALSAAADRGVTHARISLNPRELGSIEVHLRQTADGLVARVVAQHAGAAQLLQNAGGDLRRALESQGLNLLRLDIGASGEQSGGAADRQALADGAAGDGGRGTRGGQDGADDPLAALDPAAEPTTTTTTLALANGALVDVLA